MIYEQQHGDYTISTDRDRLDLTLIHSFLTQSYWARGRSLDQVQRSIDHSLPFGLYRDTEQLGFARVISDITTYAYLADVFIVESHRGQGLGQALVQAILAHPELQGLRRWCLGTDDAHGFYSKFGFGPVRYPHRQLERWGDGVD